MIPHLSVLVHYDALVATRRFREAPQINGNILRQNGKLRPNNGKNVFMDNT